MSDCVSIIAEIGINHNGLPELAKDLIDAAGNAGVYGIKFQYRNLGNIYISGHQEIGDEILAEQIERTFLSPEIILEMAQYARSKGLAAGISFFNNEDMGDFGADIETFEFYKIPSAELTNLPLIENICAYGKTVYISTGGHSETQIEKVFSSIQHNNWMPMHCVSNYPTSPENAKLGYISWLRERWKREIGYSSHDIKYENCLLAMQVGASVIERHITMDKKAPGLDHSSSSTPIEFQTICQFAKSIGLIVSGNTKREPNQGERINIQNLGRSFYFSRNLNVGDRPDINDVVYRSPKVSVDFTSIDDLIGLPLVRKCKQGEPLTLGHFEVNPELKKSTEDFAKNASLGIPVRIHDIKKFQQLFDIGSFEFHLSYQESLSDLPLSACKSENTYSIHLPDYINSDYLIDIFSEENDRRDASRKIISLIAIFAEKIQELTGKPVPIVGSFSAVHGSKEEFYMRHRDYIESLSNKQITLLPQWLPPIAWYFGGSVPVSVFNDEEDIDLVNKYQMNICLDISHYLLAANYHGFDKKKTLEKLLPLTGHVHIADSQGIDGEGLQIGEGDAENMSIISECLNIDRTKIIEIWQGHLDEGRKIIEALERLEVANT